MDAIPSQDSLQDPGRSCPSTAPSCLFTLNLCIHNVVRPLVLRVLFGFPCKSLLSTVVSTLCPPHTWTTYIMTFPFRNNFLSPLLWFGWFLMGGVSIRRHSSFLTRLCFSHPSALKTVCHMFISNSSCSNCNDFSVL